VTTNDPGATTYKRVFINWYQEKSLSTQMGTTDWTTQPGEFIVQKIPVVTRWYTFNTSPVGGATGHSTQITIYGTNADQENLLTQNTSQPQGHFSNVIGAGGNAMNIFGGTYGGEVMINVDDDTNNKWVAILKYYDWNTQAWTGFWFAHGLDKGQGWTERVFVPYAPIQITLINNDTVAHTLQATMVAP
jgi:hypothetical protein